MLLVEEALQQLLRLNAGVSAIVGSRIYPGILPQTVTYPAVVYRREGLERRMKLEYPGYGISIQRMRFFAAAQGTDRYGQAARLDAAVRTCLEGYAGTVVSDSVSPADSLVIQGIFSTDIAADDFHDASQTHQFISEFEIHF